MKMISLCLSQNIKREPFGETKLICSSTGPTDPILSKNKKYYEILAFLKIYYFLVFEKKRHKR